MAEHHPGMADAHKIKGAHPLVPLAGPGYIRNGSGNMEADWWLQTDDSISALGFVWLAHLFNRRHMLDHEWMIGRSDQESPDGSPRDERWSRGGVGPPRLSGNSMSV